MPGPVSSHAYLHPHGPADAVQERQAETHRVAELRRTTPPVGDSPVRTLGAPRKHVCRDMQEMQAHEAVCQVSVMPLFEKKRTTKQLDLEKILRRKHWRNTAFLLLLELSIV